MIGDTLAKFREMRPSVQALVFLYWIYSFTGSMVGVFTQIFLYQRFTSLSLNTLATMAFYTGIMVAFCIPGYLAARLRLNIKQGFFWGFLFMGASLFYLLHISDVFHAYIAMFFWGFGQGVFWLTVNTFELSETKDGERDFYSSMLNAGNQILGLAGPASATLLIWLSGSVFGFGTYTLLFSVAPAIYLLGFFCFAKIRDYRPQPISLADVRYYFTDHKNQVAQLYTLGTGTQQTIGVTIPPLVTLFILGTALRVGIYNILFAIFSSVCILLLARYRTPQNRLTIYGITTAGVALATAWLGYAFNFLGLIAYTFADGILSPLMNVSSHVIDLSAMEIGRKETDFYATMILRDFFLWIWRILGGVVLLLIIHFYGTGQQSLSGGMYAIAIAFLLTYFGAYLFTKMKGR